MSEYPSRDGWYVDEYQKLQKIKTERRYGDDKTIHRTGHLDVEVDHEGNVVSVWFRCQPLPFKQTVVADNRADSMRNMYDEFDITLTAVIVNDGDVAFHERDR